ncbi:MAG: 5-aminolevulinate synthase [Alphaproteobacteria bacterium]|nr:5-aminolevulinate synthase [Alphaproteobacteria bacterium]MDA7983591.1 5-aminolevulinate synthase [Alphaproteobacteria bacterium]MDA8009578.1 5-aminolevulinate synthase [Alphaproteobacteria bacterium]
MNTGKNPDYAALMRDDLNALRQRGEGRIFVELERLAARPPYARVHGMSESQSAAPNTNAGGEVQVWCSNDYLGLGQNPKVIAAMEKALRHSGAGAGGTRNIAGSNHELLCLERELAAFHKREAALVFSSGYVANMATLAALGARLENAVIFSDSRNHASMIEGMRLSRAEKQIFPHNDTAALEAMLAECPRERAKIVALESVYSMRGDFAPLGEVVRLAREHGALTFIDEVHGVGLYGENGAGLAEELGVAAETDIIAGTLAKALGCFGGYIAGSALVCDFVRAHASGFIFTTALPPYIAAGARAALRIVAEGAELRRRLHGHAARLREELGAAGLPVLESRSQIVPLAVGDSDRCRAIADRLLARHGIYIQPINYPTVARGEECLRITPSPHHREDDRRRLVAALAESWRAVTEGGT